MATVKAVAIAGASGNLGSAVLTALIDSGKFQITVIKRLSSKSEFPDSVKVIPVDFESLDSLTNALRGQDAVISTLASAASQSILIDAAITAGVKRFLPSEFGSDLDNADTRQLPVFAKKVAVQEYIQGKVLENPGFTYTILRNSAFLDWGLRVGFLLNVAKSKPTIFDGGDQLFSTTTLETVGQGVVGIFRHLEDTKNRVLYIQDMVTSQNKILSVAKRLAPDRKWETEPADLAAMCKSSDESLAKGAATSATFIPYILRSILGKGYGGQFHTLDNELLGIHGKGDLEIEAILRSILVDKD